MYSFLAIGIWPQLHPVLQGTNSLKHNTASVFAVVLTEDAMLHANGITNVTDCKDDAAILRGIRLCWGSWHLLGNSQELQDTAVIRVQVGMALISEGTLEASGNKGCRPATHD